MEHSKKRTEWLCILVLITATVIACFRSPESASDLDIVPDSVEYCAGAYNLLANGHYKIQIGAQWFPPRYSPWFSALFLLPAYVVAPCTLGAPIIVILMMSILAVLMAYRVGRSISGVGGGLAAAAFLLLLPLFRALSVTIMTDVPCTALCLTAAAIYLSLTRDSPTIRWIIAGLVCALASSMRPLAAAQCAPFLLFVLMKRPGGSLIKITAVLLPTVLMTAMTLLYNRSAFGSFLRNGYNFWCTVPYDYFSLTFGPQFAFQNAAALLRAGRYTIPLLLVLFVISGRKRKAPEMRDAQHASIKQLMLFTVTATGPLVILHLLYFFPAQRFFLPLFACLSVMAGGLAGSIVQKHSRTRLGLLLASILLASIVIRSNAPQRHPTRRRAADSIDQLVPDKATVITAVDPVYLSLALRHRNITFLPVSRAVEYASKVIVPELIASPSPFSRQSSDDRAEAIMKGESQEAVLHTADEILPQIADEIRNGQIYILETGNVTSGSYPAVAKIGRIFPATSIGQNLYRLGPPSEQSFVPAD